MGESGHHFSTHGQDVGVGSAPAFGAPAAPTVVRSIARAGIGVFECDLRTEALNWTRNVYDIFGIDRKAVPDRQQIVALYDEESRETLHRLRTRAIHRRSGFTLDAKITRPDGTDRWVQIIAQVESESGRPMRLVGTKQDITRQRTEFDALQQFAHRDSLTGLANRSVFQHRFLDASGTPLGIRPLGALLLFDVDGFKQINDVYGHAAGDMCLVQFGQRICQSFPDALMVARIGGDEFAVLLPSDRNLQRLGERIAVTIALLRMPVVWNGHLLEAGASHGVAMANNAISYDAEAMFLRADQALYAVKRAR
ncbi:MAG: diguanylate cyclase domain-containing protein [Blastomonas sp.]